MDQDLLHDLAKYKSYRDKSVSSSAQSLIQLFREKNPQLLERKDRGKPTEFQRNLQPLDFAQSNPQSFIEGAETLDLSSTNQNQSDDQSDDQDEDEDEWINVQHSDEDQDEDEEEEEEEEDKEKEDEDQQNEENEETKVEFTEEERRARAMAISSERILTQKDFEQLKIIQLKRKIQDRRRNRSEENIEKGKKQKTISIDSDDDDELNRSNSQSSTFVSLKDIEKVHKKRAHDKESRLETVLVR